jgi:hypothetical protein
MCCHLLQVNDCDPTYHFGSLACASLAALSAMVEKLPASLGTVFADATS